jgi:branched-chain amino acid transport system permease protein
MQDGNRFKTGNINLPSMTNDNFFHKLLKLIIVLVVTFVLIPLSIGRSSYLMLLLTSAFIYAIVASGLDILFGYSGQISLGQGAFFGIGAYTSAILSRDVGLHPFITLSIGAILATIVGIAIAYPISKLVSHFLSLATIAFCEIVYILVTRSPGGITGDLRGFTKIPSIKLFGFSFDSRLSYYFIVLLFIKYRILKGRVGRSFVAIRDNSEAANGMGINVRKYKVMAFAISAFYAGIAGGLHAHFKLYISPDMITRDQSILFLTMLLLGGRTSIIGSVLGACAIVLINEALRFAGTLQMLLYGIILLLVIMFLPNGLVAYVRKMNLLKKVGGLFARN